MPSTPGVALPRPRLTGTHEGMRYYVHGARGPWLAFGHATGVDHESFAAQVEHFRQRARIIVWDMPGHGASPRPLGALDLASSADVVAGLIRRVAGADAGVVLVGHSLGGYLAQHVALRHRELVAAVVAIGCTSVTIGPPRTRMALLWLSALVFAACPPPVRRLLLMRSGPASPGTRRYVRESAARVSARAAWTAWTAIARSIRDEPDRRLGRPLLVVRGTRDHTGIVPTAAAQWAGRHGARYVVVPEAGHHAHMDNPAVVNTILDKFLDEIA